MPDEIKYCSKCEHLILVGAYHRPECSEKDYLPKIIKVGDHYEPVCDNCQDFLPIKEPQ